MRVLAQMVLVFVAAVVFMLAVAWVVLRALGPSTPLCVKTVSCRFDDSAVMHVCTCRDGEACAR